MNTDPNLSAVLAFNDALNAANVDAMLACMTEDCVFENTYPPPDGERFEGRAAVRGFWKFFFSSSRSAHIEIEEIFSAGEPSTEGERVVMRWRYSWTDEHGQAGHVRGLDLYRMENRLIAEKLSYVKG
ncbi:ketosteroid isomerase-related protein [Longilinea arvoryzae]|uniref:Ketosteroid isomerase-related protein n=1 Tax=Longilinea arvoryzae TaxID=360412 RepID=A0A0K8MY38_9CHLR|nr:nuclear transport factor 2 family protein [Longilinea arvoryzae]GAP16120.1 ketosteroid isomerase-related protein [Longilinea arvoryzae]